MIAGRTPPSPGDLLPWKTTHDTASTEEPPTLAVPLYTKRR